MKARSELPHPTSLRFQSVPEFLQHFRAAYAAPRRRARLHPPAPPPLWRRCGAIVCDIALLIVALLVGLCPSA
jgi:hypothetical protein